MSSQPEIGPDQQQDEAAALRRCMRDLVALSTLPGAWVNADPLGLLESLSEVVLRMMRLDLVYIRMPFEGGLMEAGRTVRQAARTGRGAELGDWLKQWISFAAEGASARIPALEGSGTLATVLLPVGHERECGWLLAAGARAGFPDEHDRLLLGVAANQLVLTLQRKATEERLREEAESLETLNRIGETLAAELNLEPLVQQVTDSATRLCGAQFGAFFYNVQDEQGEWYQLYALAGVERDAFSRFPMPRNTAVFAPTFAGTEIVRSDDIRQDPRYGRNAPHAGLPPGHLPVVSYLAVPVVSRSREVLGGLFFGHSRPAVFGARAERMVAAVAAQAAIAIDNARLYERLRETAARLSDSDRRKDEFLATLAHELRNPLAPMRNALALLKLQPGRGDSAKSAEDILHRQLEHLVRLVDDLLDLSRVNAGKIHLQRAPTELATVLQGAVETVKPAIDRARHRLDVELPGGPILLQADPVRLTQVFSNLLNNAAKYTAPGGHLALRAERRGADEVEVIVQDNGIGIPVDMLERVFDMFTQVDRSIEKMHGGLGIGLCLVKRLVEMHGGRVQARSRGAGSGSDFVVRLPLACPAGATAAVPAGGEAVPRAGPVPRRILVVDDNVDAAESLALLLASLGHEVRVAADGPSALEAAEAQRPELVLLDIGMPGMSGHEVCARLRAQPWGRGATLAALSGWGPAAHERKEGAGFDHHFVKPVDLEQLQAFVAALPSQAPAAATSGG